MVRFVPFMKDAGFDVFWSFPSGNGLSKVRRMGHMVMYVFCAPGRLKICLAAFNKVMKDHLAFLVDSGEKQRVVLREMEEKRNAMRIQRIKNPEEKADDAPLHDGLKREHLEMIDNARAWLQSKPDSTFKDFSEWRQNNGPKLTSRLKDEWACVHDPKEGDRCPLCENPLRKGRLIVRRGSFGAFLACTEWPGCKFTYGAMTYGYAWRMPL